MIRLASSSTPITPVDAGNTCVGGTCSCLATASQQASATRSPVRVAQFALPALISTALTRPRDLVKLMRARRTGAACTRFCVNTAAAEAGVSETIKREIVLLHFANSGVHGRVAIAQRQLHAAFSPNISFSFRRWPFRNASAGIRLRPSTCTSSSSSAVPSPHAISSRFLSRHQAGRAGRRSASLDTRAFQI